MRLACMCDYNVSGNESATCQALWWESSGTQDAMPEVVSHARASPQHGHDGT